MLDTQAVVLTLISIVLAGVGWWVKNIWAMVIEQQKQITALNVELAKNYAPRVELEKTFERIFNKLDEIQHALGKR